MADTTLASDTRGTLEPLEVRIDRLLAEFWEKIVSRPYPLVDRPSTADLPPDSPPSPRHSPSLNRRKAHLRPHELRRRGALPRAHRPVQRRREQHADKSGGVTYRPPKGDHKVTRKFPEQQKRAPLTSNIKASSHGDIQSSQPSEQATLPLPMPQKACPDSLNNILTIQSIGID
ncbi:Hypothetical predicted protein [Pelobates cultripes]|uniref:Uncharacterized protein n=1 Tax=Pelobates cultripes TaxID=61616 RepID=A0AAD1VTE1_PELCU|nr:Hypothetical predicted protein [Pelobates cultripes]